AASLEARRGATELKKTKICENCGKVYRAARADSRFCSLKCFGASISTSHRTCVWCGQPFVAKRHDGKYCTFECSVEAAKKPPPPPIGERACGWCGATFTPQRKDKHFCSRSCAVNQRRARAREVEVAPALVPGFVCELVAAE
ncbi:MAG: hypothetical protein HC829_02450, partial [Bacteroidales bacterium]|nr:hypothetical protein [Bacteroidales bacterium]